MTASPASCYSISVDDQTEEESLSMTNLRDTMIMSCTDAIIRIRMMAMITLAVGVSPG